MTGQGTGPRSPRRPPRGPDAPHRAPSTTAPRRKRRSASGQASEDAPPEAVFEIRVAEGADGERLARQQARVLWEVTEWLARNKSEHGPRNAA